MKKKNARWIHRTHLFRKDEYECSSCGYTSDKALRICPRCKKDMRGVEFDPSWVDEMEFFDAIFDD